MEVGYRHRLRVDNHASVEIELRGSMLMLTQTFSMSGSQRIDFDLKTFDAIAEVVGRIREAQAREHLLELK